MKKRITIFHPKPERKSLKDNALYAFCYMHRYGFFRKPEANNKVWFALMDRDLGGEYKYYIEIDGQHYRFAIQTHAQSFAALADAKVNISRPRTP